MQDDGNLVECTAGGRPVWASDTAGGVASSGLAAKVDAFVSTWKNKGADYDRRYGYQCVDLFNFYSRDVIGAPFAPVDYAYQLYDIYDSSKYTRLSSSATPQKGDVAVWSSLLPGSGSAGHVAGVLGVAAAGQLSIFTQNPGLSHVATMHRLPAGIPPSDQPELTFLPTGEAGSQLSTARA